MGRLFREAPVNSIWEGSGNVMCLDVLRAIARSPGDAQLVLGQLADIATQAQAPAVAAQVKWLQGAMQLPPEQLEPQARRFTQKLALATQACLMLQHASPEAAAAFVDSRFDADWGPVAGITAGTANPAALLQAAWAE
jgi:putative acyl-CoA dehydrogenase